MTRILGVVGSIFCVIFGNVLLGQVPPAAGTPPAIPPKLHALFVRLDASGRDKVKDAKFVELHLSNADKPETKATVEAWLLSEDERTVTVLKDDLLPWTYQKKSATKMPCSWRPVSVRLDSITDADFGKLCEELVKRKPAAQDDHSLNLYDFGPSHRLLIAHAAWKKGLSHYCLPLLTNEPDFKSDFNKYQAAVLEDLAWLHFLRGVNLLMFADRREVIPHFRLILELSPKGEYAADARDLADRLQRLVAEEGSRSHTNVDAAKLPETERAKSYLCQLHDIFCPQQSQPGFVEPYAAVVDGKPDEHPPTLKLKEMGMAAVPALIAALEDQTPTRTVFHWRDFAKSRVVWRVSDFAYAILRDISRKGREYPCWGFRFNFMTPEEKRRCIRGFQEWYAANKDRTTDERMVALFSSDVAEEWVRAGEYFLEKNDRRVVKLLLANIPRADSFRKGRLIELVARFCDPSAKEPLKSLMTTADDPSDRVFAAIGLWMLGDESGIPVVIKLVKAKEPPCSGIWFLMYVRTKESIDALESVVREAPPQRVVETVNCIMDSLSEDFHGQTAGCVEVCRVLIAGMERSDYTGSSIDDVKIRIKDVAANALVLMKEGTDRHAGRFSEADPKVFNECEPDEAKRDAQIRSLKEWYKANKGKLVWDAKKRKLAVK